MVLGKSRWYVSYMFSNLKRGENHKCRCGVVGYSGMPGYNRTTDDLYNSISHCPTMCVHFI